MDLENYIRETLYPKINVECSRLGVPPEFILGIDHGRLDKFQGECCRPSEIDEKSGVFILLPYWEKRPRGARGSFHHGMKHAEQYYKNLPLSELRAYLYMFKRGIQEDYRSFIDKLKNSMPFLRGKNLSYSARIS